MRALIADDEPRARALLRGMLEDADGVEVVGEAASGDEAVRLLRELAPDIVFLDVMMPHLTGTDVARAIGRGGPAVVFVTAYDRHALEAFELGAVDYLLKPFDDERLRETLARVRERRPRASDELSGLLDLVRDRGRAGERIFLTDRDRTVIRRLRDIDWIEAKLKVLHVRSGGATWTTPGPLSELEARLDPATFVRISRGVIVNLDRVAEVQPWFGGELVLLMADGARVTTSRGYRSRLDVVLGRIPRRERGE